MFDGISPYQQVPFQFSLHVQDASGSPLIHHSFLADGADDPRPEFIRQLRRLLSPKGSVIVYNAPFETGVLNRLAEALPEHDAWVGSVPEAERQQVRRQLEEYCGQDTEGMEWIVEELTKLANVAP